MRRKGVPCSAKWLVLLFTLAWAATNTDLFLSPCFGEEDVVVAVVNDTPVHRSQLDRAAEEYRKASRKKNLSPHERSEILKGLIRRQLILNHKEVEALRKDPAIAKKVKEYEDQLVISRYLGDRVGKNLSLTDADLKAYYQSHITQFASTPKVRASHVLLRSRAEAETVMAKLKAGGDFAALAKLHSIDLPMALEGGSMGVIEKGRSLPEIEKALFLLKEGDVSEIVETRYGFHILTVNEIIGQKYKSFDEVKEEIRKFLIMEKEAKAFDQMASDLERTAVITVYENRLIEAASP